LEPHSNRIAIRHRFHCHAVTSMKNQMALAALACCIPVMTTLLTESVGRQMQQSTALPGEFH
jgi:hypothetical protein